MENEGDGGNLDISALLQGAENTSCDTIGETMLVHLGC